MNSLRASQEGKMKKETEMDVEPAEVKGEGQDVSIRKNDDDEIAKKQPKPDDPANNNDPSLLSDLSISELARIIQSPVIGTRLPAVIQIRKLLSVEHNPPLAEVISTGAIPTFISFLGNFDEPKLQFESAWILTNIASGTSEQTNFVVEEGAIPAFIRLLSASNEDLLEQAAWALGNIAGDSFKNRDLVLSEGALQPLLNCLTNSQKIQLLRNGSWALSNFCRGKPPPPLHLLQPAIPVLNILLHNSDEEALADCCWSLSYLTDGTNDRIEAVVKVPGFVSRVVELLAHEKSAIKAPALRVVGNIMTGDESHTQSVLDCPSALPTLRNLLTIKKKSIQKEACWSISNITAGTVRQIQMVIDAQIIPLVMHLLKSSVFDIRKEAAWAISNVTSGGSIDQVLYLVQQNAIPMFCELLSSYDLSAVSVCLEGLGNILKHGSNANRFGATNPFVHLVEECGGTALLNELVHHQNLNISGKVNEVLEYFEADDDDEPPPVQLAVSLNNIARENNVG